MNHVRTVVKTKPVSYVKLGGKGQVTIPPAIVKRLRLKRGEELSVGILERDKVIVLTPRRAIPKDQQWYYTPRWQKMMQEAFEDLKAGRMLGPFDSVEEFKQSLKTRASRS